MMITVHFQCGFRRDTYLDERESRKENADGDSKDL